MPGRNVGVILTEIVDANDGFPSKT